MSSQQGERGSSQGQERGLPKGKAISWTAFPVNTGAESHEFFCSPDNPAALRDCLTKGVTEASHGRGEAVDWVGRGPVSAGEAGFLVVKAGGGEKKTEKKKEEGEEEEEEEVRGGRRQNKGVERRKGWGGRGAEEIGREREAFRPHTYF